MQYEVEIGGRLRQVAVTRTGDTFAVSVDGRIRHVDAARIDGHSLSLLVDTECPGNDPSALRRVGLRLSSLDAARDASEVLEGSKAYEVSIVADAASGQHVVHVGTVPVAVTLNGRRRWGRKEEHRSAGSEPQRLIAPMPGKVVRVLANVGDRVAARQPVVVVEAMKMENELRASREGTVAEIHAREGMSVDAGALLIVIQ